MSPTSYNSSHVWLTPAQVAKRFHVSPITVRNWANTGKLASVTTPGGHRRFNLSVVEDFAARHRSGNPAEAVLTCTSQALGQAAEQSRFLAVDCDRSTQEMLAAVIKIQHPRAITVCANNAFEAGFLCREQQPRLVFLDTTVLDCNPEAICQFMRTQESLQGTSIIVIARQPSDRQKLQDAGAAYVLCKPFGLSELDAAVKQILV